MSNTYVIKLGGSTISKSQENIFDFDYLAKFKQTLIPFIERGDRFCIILGGGFIMRHYRDLARGAGVTDDLGLHWIGTTVNVLHAYIVKAYFGELASDKVIKYEDYYDDKPISFDENVVMGGGSSVILGGGGRPGHSGDVDAILAADKIGASKVISLKNVDSVYDSDPSKYPDAKPVNKINWSGYLDIIGNKDVHEPGGNYPIDPIASRMADERSYSFVIVGAEDLNNFSRVLNGEEFHGTLVEN